MPRVGFGKAPHDAAHNPVDDESQPQNANGDVQVIDSIRCVVPAADQHAGDPHDHDPEDGEPVQEQGKRIVAHGLGTPSVVRSKL